MKEQIIYKYFPDLPQKTMQQLAQLSSVYEDWNSKINVISRKDMDNFYTHHVLHSLALVKYLRDNDIRPSSIFDAGTGGGFPGIPMAVLMPECEFTLCDSIAKKIKVVTEVSTALGLTNVTPVCARTETLRERKYDYVVSRAVTELKKFIPLTSHLYTKGVLYLKGGDTQSEIDMCCKELKLQSSMFKTVNISDYFEEEFFETKRILVY